MSSAGNLRVYDPAGVATFRKTTELWGGLSNMAGGFPLRVNGVRIASSEALYQACRFPHQPEVQRIILNEASPMTAKMRSRPHRSNSRPDWERVRIAVMRWCLRVKLACNWITFGDLLRATGSLPIVEDSRRDRFWGATLEPTGLLEGTNALGRLLMELRDQLTKDAESLRAVQPPDIASFFLLGEPVRPVFVAPRDEFKREMEAPQSDLFLGPK